MGWSEIMMHPIEGAKKTPLNGCVRNNDAFSAGRAVAHLTHASSQKVGGRSGDILGRSGRHTAGKSVVNSVQIGARVAKVLQIVCKSAHGRQKRCKYYTNRRTGGKSVVNSMQIGARAAKVLYIVCKSAHERQKCCK